MTDKEYMRKWRKENLEQERKIKTKAYLKQRERWLAYAKARNESIKTTVNQRYIRAKGMEKFKNKSWMLTKDDFSKLLKKTCYYCNISLVNFTGSCLDRIDNTRGYEIDNVLPCCGKCNKTRGDQYTVEDTKVMVSALVKFKQKKLGVTDG